MNLGNSYNIALELWGSIFSFAVFFILNLGKQRQSKENRYMSMLVLCNTLLLLSDMLAWYFDGDPSRLGYVMVRLSNFSVNGINIIMLALYTAYAVMFLKHTDMVLWISAVIYLLCVVAAESLVISQFTGMYYYFDQYNAYHRGSYFALSHIFMIICMILGIIMLVTRRNDMTRARFMALVSYILLPLVAACVQMGVYGYSLSIIATTMSVFVAFAVSVSEQNKIIMRQEMALHDMQLKLVLSQIKPHFLYNCLNTIYILCRRDAGQAQEAISDFSDYLRCNMNSLTSEGMVPFETEMKHVTSYLSLEKMRFQDDLKVEYDIQARDFTLPSLTVEPLVENAVKHGVGKKSGGGTVSISTREAEDSYQIVIRDDGVGFDPDSLEMTGEDEHIGIANVRSRLRMMCQGSLKIISAPGEGTTMIVQIGKGEPA